MFIALTLLAPAQAADGVLYYFGNGSGSYWSLDTAAATALQDAGADPVVQSETWPESLDAYRLILLSARNGAATAFDATQVGQLQSFLADGGVLWILGENGTYFEAANENFNALLEDLGSTMSLTGGAYEVGCGWEATTAASKHPLMRGVTALEYAFSGDLEPGSGTLLATGASGQGILAVEGRLLLSADFNIVAAACSIPEQNQLFLANLFDVASDWDDDGVTGPIAGGEDCNDDDPSVFPGNDESWYDGVDQDCIEGNEYDQDDDGYDAQEYGGEDCDDTDPDYNPDAEDTWYDGFDSDCAGDSDYDQDGDGYDLDAYGGEDCDDTDPDISPDAEEILDDGVDQDCDGEDATTAPGEDTGSLDDSGSGPGTGGGKNGAGCSVCTSAGGGHRLGVVLALLGLVLTRRRR